MRQVTTDVLVIGGGSAATRAAIDAARAGAQTTLVDKGRPSESGSSPHALVGFSVPMLDDADSEELFFRDWISASGGVCDRNLVRQIFRNGRTVAEDVQKIGVEFISNADGTWFISKRAGHSARRTLMVKGLGGGKHSNAMAPLRAEVEKQGVNLLENTMVTRLLKSGDRVVGAYALDEAGEPIVFNAKAVVLAAGGANRIYSKLCSEVVEHYKRTMGDSYSLAFHAGAPFVDMEFVQFRDSPPAGPIYGAHYMNRLGERIMEKYDPVALETAPRYMMARAVYWENLEGRGPVVWHVEKDQIARSRAPVGEADYKPGDIVEIVLMFQRLTGGPHIDENAQTGVPGLFAAGESSGGALGGDRMQGCGFLETQVFGGIAGRNAAALAKASALTPIDASVIEAERQRLASGRGDKDPAELVETVRNLMWEQAGVVSNRALLTDAIQKLQALRKTARDSLDLGDVGAAEEARSLALTAELVAQAKLAREETRSGHGRTDFPDMDEAWGAKHVRLSRTGADAVAVSSVPVVMS